MELDMFNKLDSLFLFILTIGVFLGVFASDLGLAVGVPGLLTNPRGIVLVMLGIVVTGIDGVGSVDTDIEVLSKGTGSDGVEDGILLGIAGPVAI
jgi:hypothetical protein